MRIRLPRAARTLLQVLLPIGALLPTAPACADVNFPTKTVTIVVPFSPGGASDAQARLLAHKLTQTWGKPVVVDNKPGASASIGMQFIAGAPADGHTLIVSDLGTLTIGPALRKLPYQLDRDFAPVTLLSYSPYLLTAHPSTPYNTLAELLAFSRANPTRINYGTSGAGTTPHLTGRLFSGSQNLQWTDIHSKGGAQTIQDVVSGHVDLQFNTAFSTAAHVKSGRLKALAVSSDKRLADLPDVPALTETMPGFIAGSFQGILAPAATPADVLEKLNRDIVAALNADDVRSRLQTLGADPRPGPAADLRKFLDDDRARWAKLVKDQKISLDD